MSQEIYPMSEAGFKALEEKVKHLKQERPDVIQAIADAKAHGDLSENAEYKAAKEKQRSLEETISKLEHRLACAQIVKVDPSKKDMVCFGAAVKLKDQASGREITYKIVGEDEANIRNGLLSISSPLAKGLLSKKRQDAVSIETPGGTKHYTVEEIQYT